MGIGAVNQLHSIRWVHSGGTLTLSQLEDLSPGTGTEILSRRAAGTFYTQFAAVRQQMPEIVFRTPQLQSMFLNLVNFDQGFSKCVGASDLHYKALTDHGIASTTGERIRMMQGMLYWETISASHNGDATIVCRIVPTYDGTNAPLVSTSQTVAGSSTAAEHFGMGPVVLNGSVIDGVIDVTIASNARILKKGTASEPWDRACYLVELSPVITIRTHDHDRWTTHGMTPTEITASGSVGSGLEVYFRMKDENGVNVSAVSTVHPYVQMEGGLLYVDGSSGANTDPPVVTLVAVGANAGTSSLDFSAGEAIP